MNINNIQSLEYISNSLIAYTPRLLSTIAIAISTLALAALIASPGASLTMHATCLNVAIYSAIVGGGLTAFSLIRDIVAAILVGEENDFKEGMTHLAKNASQTLAAPLIGGVVGGVIAGLIYIAI